VLLQASARTGIFARTGVPGKPPETASGVAEAAADGTVLVVLAVGEDGLRVFQVKRR
jgi:hypothetical protein